MTNAHSIALKIAAGLWVVWGLVHIFAGIVIISNPAAGAVAAVADAVDPAVLTGPYHEAANALINQHGFNLAWIGLTTLIAAVFIWRKSLLAAFIAGLVGGLADVGYFIFMDLGGFVHFMPGTVMTIFLASAILLSLWVWMNRRPSPGPVPFLVPPQVLVYATFRSKATGLFQPSAECRRRGL